MASASKTSGGPKSHGPLSGPAIDPDIRPSGPGPRLSFHPKTLRVQVTFTAEHCAESPLPPVDLAKRARAKMQAVKEAGEVAFYTVYTRRLELAWETMRRQLSVNRAPVAVTLTLAAGAPELPGLSIEAPTVRGILALLSIDAPAPTVASWPASWIILHLRKALRDRGEKARPNQAQIFAAWLRAKSGQSISQLAIKARPRRSSAGGVTFHLEVNRMRREVTLVVHELSAVADLGLVKERIARVESAVAKLEPSPRSEYRILKDELLEAIREALAGPEQLGLNLPLTLLAAYDPAPIPHIKPAISAVPAAKAHPEHGILTPARPLPAAASKPALLTFTVAADGMLAAVDQAPGFASGRLPSGDDWLAGELARAGIVHGYREAAAADILDRLIAGTAPTGVVVAEGTPPTIGTGPFLHLATDMDDIRSYHRHILAQPDQLVAEIRYEVPGTPGRTVTGQTLPPVPSESPLTIEVGEGIEERGSGQFHATKAGVVASDGKSTLSLTEVLVHQGDANLTSGDIRFDGAVEIKGDIDSGVRVHAGGDLTVHGEIRGAHVDCGGNLIVERGIVVGASGEVKVKGDVQADFIEASTLTSGGSVTVTRSILHSRIMAGGSIAVNSPSGLVGGGTLACGPSLTTANLGLPDGTRTEVDIGIDFKAERAVHIRKARLEALTHLCEDERRSFKDIMKKPPPHLSKAEKLAKDRLRGRLTRWSGILEAAKRHLEAAVNQQRFDETAKISVSGKLSSNCQIRIGGRPIPIAKETFGVVITAVEENGSYLKQKA